MISFHSPVGHIYFPPVNPSSTGVIISPRLRHWSSTETMISRLCGFWENVVDPSSSARLAIPEVVDDLLPGGWVDLTSLLTANILTLSKWLPLRSYIRWMWLEQCYLSVFFVVPAGKVLLAAGNHPIIPVISSSLPFPLLNECYLGYCELNFIWKVTTVSQNWT